MQKLCILGNPRLLHLLGQSGCQPVDGIQLLLLAERLFLPCSSLFQLQTRFLRFLPTIPVAIP